MKHLFTLIFLVVIFICACYTAPADNNDTNKDSKSAFGPAFDEIVVESHLTVRRKSNARQARTQNGTTEAPKIKAKREIRNPLRQPPFSASAANSQSQSFNSFGPLGTFGASAASSQSQNFGFGPNGILESAGFSGTQQYMFNGQTIDIAFGGGFSGNQGAVVTVTGHNGKKRPLRM
ncbi:uncharacterized protein LOC123006363 [Tribolium madens]|uniref:uncharacterized protein LOC123006363 n=1 Tax=Tribolium madens TaxID=41895 RepID=UPI001CF7379C|nr:uncharacterized protein LOC123006363 [Tribolium madens]